jgi:hypothetical protein
MRVIKDTLSLAKFTRDSVDWRKTKILVIEFETKANDQIKTRI